MRFISNKTIIFIPFALAFVLNVNGQAFKREFDLAQGGTVEVINHFGRVDSAVSTETPTQAATETVVSSSETASAPKVSIEANSSQSIADTELIITKNGGRIKIEVAPANPGKRIDLSLVLPPRSKLKIETLEGEVRVAGDLEVIEIKTETGTIAADVPLENLHYNFLWTASRPRFLSDFELEEVKEKSGGKFAIKGRVVGEKEMKEKKVGENGSEPGAVATGLPSGDQKSKTNDQKPTNVTLNFTTARGIILLNVPPNEVSSDLRERPLTNAAKAIIRSGDSLLMEAIRRASPKYFGDYAKTLPPSKREPSFTEKTDGPSIGTAQIKKVLINVTDANNRAIGGLNAKDFEVLENNTEREILSVDQTTAPFNLVLLLDVSGSVENYVNFIRKAARNFIDTVEPDDRISIVIFNEDVKVLSGFTTDKQKLSESLDTFDAGGGTAYYDSLAYTLADTLRPLKGERTAIVVLTDGDDNRSFLAFDSLLGSIQESGALIYPLYVPSALIAASATGSPNSTVDPLRTRYINVNLTSKAKGEGEKLAQVSGGVYYPITQLSQIQKAYDDIVVQLRTAYTITFRSHIGANVGSRASPRLKVKVKRENAFVKIGSVVEVKE